MRPLAFSPHGLLYLDVGRDEPDGSVAVTPDIAERFERAFADDPGGGKGRIVTPILIDGRKITTTFWGKAWCDNLESYSDYANRLPRGRSYVRNGAIVHLEIGDAKVEALVRGSSTYAVKLVIKALPRPRWNAVIDECSGQVTSLVELLTGKLSRGVMEIVTDYGVGARLDHEPELLFRLRGVDPTQLIAKSVGRAAAKASRPRARALAEDTLGDIFGIEMDAAPPQSVAPKPPRARMPPAAKATTTSRRIRNRRPPR